VQAAAAIPPRRSRPAITVMHRPARVAGMTAWRARSTQMHVRLSPIRGDLMTLKNWLLELTNGDGYEAWFNELPSRAPAEQLYDAWSDAHIDSELAYQSWRADGGADAYAAYRAAADREDAAQDELARAPR
jgi:hypothetical protein